MEKDQQPRPEERNGVLVFPPGVPVKLPDGLPDLPANVYSPFGFKLATVTGRGGRRVQVWTAAAECDYRAALARLRGVRPEEVDLGPAEGPGGRCHLWNGVCTGDCASTQFCTGIYDIGQGLVGCQCS